MDKVLDQLTVTSVESQEQAVGLIEKLLTVARPEAVFGEPITVEGRTLITASEVNVGLGVGFGFGGGSAPSDAEKGTRSGKYHNKGATSHERVVLEGEESEEEAEGEEPEDAGAEAGMGAGGGGGGGASGRPVAVISVSEKGVRVEPVVDVTKIAIAFFTAFGSMAFMLAKMRKAAEEGLGS